ncbi:MAG: exonuclease SbcCD subunit D [Acidobacteria bacterium]|nr:exonuclease SbcCD subunit D [Acidobacteriota bacterium]
MRFIHTADWHLGRLFHGRHLTDDQAHVLNQLVDLVNDAKADALLIAGDIYDRAVPPPEAVTLLDDILSRVAKGLNVPVILIAGNHDSPHRLAFGSRLLATEGLHIFGSLAPEIMPVVLHDGAGPVYIYSLPYAEPSVVRECLACDTIQDHNTAMRALLARVREIHPPGQRSILVTHAFVAGGQESESERPLSVGGASTVDPACFQGFHYVALGHLHRPQTASSDSIRYSGSLLKYSFSEANHVKSVHLVEMDAQGNCQVERLSLTPRRDLRCLEGYLADLLQGPEAGESRDDYIMVTLLDTGAILDAIGKLREVYPNVLHIERPFLMTGGQVRGLRTDHRTMDDAQLFSQFFSQVTGEDLTKEQAAAFASIVNAMRRRQREATA